MTSVTGKTVVHWISTASSSNHVRSFSGLSNFQRPRRLIICVHDKNSRNDSSFSSWTHAITLAGATKSNRVGWSHGCSITLAYHNMRGTRFQTQLTKSLFRRAKQNVHKCVKNNDNYTSLLRFSLTKTVWPSTHVYSSWVICNARRYSYWTSLV